MTWVRSSSRGSMRMDASPDRLRAFLSDIVPCGLLMPTVRSLRHVSGQVYSYELDEFSNGTVSLAPRYEAQFDLRDPAAIRWEPHGEHNFRSWGAFLSRAGATPHEAILEIETHADADLSVPAVMVPLVRPFANRSSDEVTRGFLANIKAAVERLAVTGAADLGHADPDYR
jgi:hypothetical protein